MGAADLVWMALILAGAGWLLYRSLVKGKGHCPGCDQGRCDDKPKSSPAARAGRSDR